MKTLFKIYTNDLSGGQKISIEFGIPNEKEKLEMFKLRYEVYVSEKKYIPKEIAINKECMDIDEHDLLNQCTYFVAKCEDVVIGTARIISSDPLPVEKEYFDFLPPKKIRQIEKKNLAEIGRIISRPQKLKEKNFPRSIVMLGLFYTMTLYGNENNILGGYGAIKEKAYNKFQKLNIPMYKVKGAKLKFNHKSEDPLKNFFSENDPVVMVYFITSEVKKYFNIVLENSKLFKESTNGDGYVFTNRKLNLIDKILLILKLKLI